MGKKRMKRSPHEGAVGEKRAELRKARDGGE